MCHTGTVWSSLHVGNFITTVEPLNVSHWICSGSLARFWVLEATSHSHSKYDWSHFTLGRHPYLKRPSNNWSETCWNTIHTHVVQSWLPQCKVLAYCCSCVGPFKNGVTNEWSVPDLHSFLLPHHYHHRHCQCHCHHLHHLHDKSVSPSQ